MSLRRRSVLLRVALLVLVPLVFLVGLSSYTVATSVTGALTLIRSKVMMDDLRQPVAGLQQALTHERAQMIVYYARPTPAALAALRRQQAVTDRAVASVLAATGSGSVRQSASAGGKKAIAALREVLSEPSRPAGQDHGPFDRRPAGVHRLQRHDRRQLPGDGAGDTPGGQLHRRCFPGSRSSSWRSPTSTCSRRARCWTATSLPAHSRPATTRPSCGWSARTGCCTRRATRTSIRRTAAT